jgi:hypothetical protein
MLSRLASPRYPASFLRRLRALPTQARYASDLPPPPPLPSTLLARLPKEVHAALRAKDKPRLGALRSLLAEVTNSSKTPHPIADDLALLGAINRRIAATRAAVEEFGQAGRPDLVASEEASLAVYREYAGEVKTMGDEEIREVILQVVAGLREGGKTVNAGAVIRDCLRHGGPFEGRMVSKGSIARLADKTVKAADRT